jgi:toxin ParE1/3/4
VDASKVVFSRRADQRLTELYDYIADNSSPEIAIGYIRRLREACLALAQFPERGRRRDDILPGLRTVGFERRVTIAFRIRRRRVEIITIAYGGRDFERELRKGK